jgi:predicted enzyme related to lactoylglutathione lyase
MFYSHVINSHVIGSHINERIVGLSTRRTVRFYNSLMDKGREKEECFLSHLLKKSDRLNGVPLNNTDEDFIRPTYIIVEDLERETRKAKRLGAKVIQEKTAVNGTGFFSLISDPTGGVVSLWQKADRVNRL